MREAKMNWAGNIRYQASEILRPCSIEQVQELMSRAPRVKALGSRHSFNRIADTNGLHLCLSDLNRIGEVDIAARQVTIEAGVRHGDLCRPLSEAGLALPNLASLPHISIAGAAATATHGSGDRNACLASSVAAMDIVTADGSLRRIARGDEDFAGAVVHLGGLGVVVRLTLNLIPEFQVRQYVFEGLSLETALSNLDEIFGADYSVSLFTSWREPIIEQAWVKSTLAEPLSRDFFGATPATEGRHPIPGMAVESCTEQLGVAGPWHARLAHFRLEHTPSAGDELQSEYLVPRERAKEAIAAIAQMREEVTPHLQISEMRSVAADDLWMSPFYQQPCLGIHFTWKPDWPSVRALLSKIEAALEPFGARPHWGKLFTMGRESIEPLFPKLPEFRRLAIEWDPEGKFSNEFLRRFL